jgi:bifunctional DNase/RNase
MQKIELQITALSNSETSPGNFVVVLEEQGGRRKLAIIIGAFEAQSIAIHLERMQLPRPMTHDILKSAILELGGNLREVIIHTIQDGVFHAWLVLTDHTGQEKKLDVRSSDALSLAVRFDCPISIYDYLLAETAIQEPTDRKSLIKGSLAEFSLEELQSLLEDVLAKEDYESAGRIRDMIRRRQGGH